MAITDRIFDGLKAAIQLNTRVESAVGRRLETLAREVRDIDRRLIRVETALEPATSGRLTLPRPLADPSDEEPRLEQPALTTEGRWRSVAGIAGIEVRDIRPRAR